MLDVSLCSVQRFLYVPLCIWLGVEVSVFALRLLGVEVFTFYIALSLALVVVMFSIAIWVGRQYMRIGLRESVVVWCDVHYCFSCLLQWLLIWTGLNLWFSSWKSKVRLAMVVKIVSMYAM